MSQKRTTGIKVHETGYRHKCRNAPHELNILRQARFRIYPVPGSLNEPEEMRTREISQKRTTGSKDLETGYIQDLSCACRVV